jgi:hypothetical protein
MMSAHFTSTFETHASWLSKYCTVAHWYGGVFAGQGQYPGYVLDVRPHDEVLLGEESISGHHVLYAKLHEAETTGDLVDVRCVSFPVTEETFTPMVENYRSSCTPIELVQTTPMLGYRYFLPAMHQKMRVWLRTTAT